MIFQSAPPFAVATQLTWKVSHVRSSCLFLATTLVLLAITTEIIAEEIDFNRDVRPLLNQHCTACHGGVKQAADISFVYRDQVVAPDGWIVEPGKPNESSLMERIASEDPEDRMPPPEHGRGLNKTEIEIFRRWIEQGAKWKQHWAFEKPTLQKIPETENSAGPASLWITLFSPNWNSGILRLLKKLRPPAGFDAFHWISPVCPRQSLSEPDFSVD